MQRNHLIDIISQNTDVPYGSPKDRGEVFAQHHEQSCHDIVCLPIRSSVCLSDRRHWQKDQKKIRQNDVIDIAVDSHQSNINIIGQRVPLESFSRKFYELIHYFGYLTLVFILAALLSAGAVKFHQIDLDFSRYNLAYFGKLLFLEPDLSLGKIIFTREKQGNREFLTIHSVVNNHSSRTQSVPKIELTLFQEKKHKIYEWIYRSPINEIAGGKTLGFSTSIENPPKNAKTVMVRFITDYGTVGK